MCRVKPFRAGSFTFPSAVPGTSPDVPWAPDGSKGRSSFRATVHHLVEQGAREIGRFTEVILVISASHPACAGVKRDVCRRRAVPGRGVLGSGVSRYGDAPCVDSWFLGEDRI